MQQIAQADRFARVLTRARAIARVKRKGLRCCSMTDSEHTCLHFFLKTTGFRGGRGGGADRGADRGGNRNRSQGDKWENNSRDGGRDQGCIK